MLLSLKKSLSGLLLLTLLMTMATPTFVLPQPWGRRFTSQDRLSPQVWGEKKRGGCSLVFKCHTFFARKSMFQHVFLANYSNIFCSYLEKSAPLAIF